MKQQKADIIERLKREILPLQGYRSAIKSGLPDMGLGPVNAAFPDGKFPLGSIHEFIACNTENATAASGFIAAIVGSLMNKSGAAIWIGSQLTIFPPALKSFGIVPENIIFIDLQNQKDILWTIEEALKCDGLSAVIGELPELSFTGSRRLQLAVEKSRVTGFILRKTSRSLSTTAAIARWNIKSLPGHVPENLPGVGFARWQVELLKVRNGRPGKWEVEWSDGKFHPVSKIAAILPEQKRKTG